MFIIIQNECIDTSIFKRMKLYPIPGIIAFIYKDPISGENVELPVTFDDAFDAELTYDEIQECFENDKDAFVVIPFASVPAGLLAKMKRGLSFLPHRIKEYQFSRGSSDTDTGSKK
jgi:hypothetical protein